MNTEQYKIKLLAEKDQLEDELSGIGFKDSDTGAWEASRDEQTAPEADDNDLATLATNYEEKMATVGTLSERLHDVEDALTKIENNTYGICEVCGKPIEAERLAANPAARTCEACMNQ